eukprot:jgi/Mesvir1/18257/Mv09529-RA.1
MPATPRPMMKVLLPWDPGNRPRIQHTPDVDYLLVGWAMPQNEVYRHELPTAVFVGSVVPVTDVAGLASLKESLSGWDPGLRAHAHESSQEHPRHTLGESLPATSRRTVPPVSRSGDHAGIRPTCSRAQQEEGSGKEIGMSAWPHHGPPRIMGSWTIHPASANKGTAASTIPQARVITDRWLSDADQQAMGAAAREHGDRDVNIRALARAGALGPGGPGMKLKGGSGPRVRRQQQVQQGWLAGEDAAHAGGAGGDCTPTANPCPFPSLAGVEVTSMNVVGTSGERWQRRLGGHACCISQHPSHPLDPPSRSDPESSIARSCSRCLVFGGIATALGILAGLVLLLWRRLLLLVLWIPLQLRHVCKSRQRSARVNNGRTNLQHASSSTDACIGGRASMATDDVPALYRTSQLAAQPHAGVVRTSERSRQGRAYRQEPRRPTAAPHSIAADSLLETRHFLTRGRGLLTGPRDPPLGSSRNGVAHGGDLPHPSWASSMAHIDGSTSTGHDSASGRKQGKRAAELFPRAAARLVLPSSPQPGAAAAAAKVAAAAVAATSIHEHRVATCHPPTSAAPPIPLAAAPRHRCCPADPRLGPAGGGRCLLPADILTSPLSLVMVARRLYEAWLWPWLLVRSVGAVDREVVVDRMVSLLVDVTLGVLAAATLLRHEPHGCHLVASLLACQASLATSALTWLTGAPAGIKLNPELVHFLAATTGAIMRVWVAALSALPPASITWLVRLVAAAGLCGLSSILFVSGDLVGLLFLPMTVAHGALSLLLRAHLRMLTQLWRGLRGRKHNPLRLRLDTFECGADQMVLGALLFTPMLLLLPTATAFALTSAVFRALPLMATAALQYAGCLLATVPWFSAVVAWLAPRTSRHRCGGGATALADASAHGNELRVWAGVGSGWPAQFPMEQRGNLTCAVSPLDMKKRAWTQEVVVCGHIGLVGRG